ncbi:hypothetical protein TNCV_2236501 [Trichonephila clavipes]|nr:hypothetical protein TNCV_2236501 [Trichonephila clavipes]
MTLWAIPSFSDTSSWSYPHRAHLVDKYLQLDSIQLLEWTVISHPNHIGHVWDVFGHPTAAARSALRTPDELKGALDVRVGVSVTVVDNCPGN